jgi:hypothetical protein
MGFYGEERSIPGPGPAPPASTAIYIDLQAHFAIEIRAIKAIAGEG